MPGHETTCHRAVVLHGTWFHEVAPTILQDCRCYYKTSRRHSEKLQNCHVITPRHAISRPCTRCPEVTIKLCAKCRCFRANSGRITKSDQDVFREEGARGKLWRKEPSFLYLRKKLDARVRLTEFHILTRIQAGRMLKTPTGPKIIWHETRAEG